MKYVQVTKLVNGYIPTRVWVNPQAVLYIEEVLQRRAQGGDAFIEVPMGTRLVFVEDSQGRGHIDVKEPPQTVVCLLSGLRRESVPDTCAAWEANRERIADEVYGVQRG